MMLQTVTFTGADDRTNPADLIEFSRLYPWVEWGILIGTRQGVPRMPSKEWIEALLQAKKEDEQNGGTINLSLHVCGQPLKAMASGRSIVGEGGASIVGFDRMQLNWHGERTEEIGNAIARAVHSMFLEFGWDPEVIFQGDAQTALEGLHCPTEEHGFVVSVLFDSSHGRGESPKTWPPALGFSAGSRWNVKCGYAGGLGPSNLLQQLEAIKVAHVGSLRPFWIDMETHVRTDELFDLRKCNAVCELVKNQIYQEF